MLFVFILIITSVFGFSLPQENTKLLLVQTLFRHGDRSPEETYEGDPSMDKFRPQGFGKLTLLGRKQQYAVGKYLRSMYNDFITTNPNEIVANSSHTDRCIRSAEANLASFYAPVGIWKFEDNLDWQPIPVYYVPFAEQDKYLSFPDCPRVISEIKNLLLSDDVQSFFRSNQKSFDELSKLAGFNVSQGLNAMMFYDALHSEKVHNFSLPRYIKPYSEILQKGSDLIFHSFFMSPELARLRAGPLLQFITEKMQAKMNGSLSDLKVQVYSSHADNLGAVLYALTSSYWPQPPFSATIIFELHRLQDKSGAVRVLYLNSTTPETNVGPPHVITVKGCSELCPLHKFAALIEPLVPEDWDAECQQDGGGMNPKMGEK